MIVRPAHHWFRMLFVWNGSVLRSILPQLAFMTLVSVLAVANHGRVFGEKIPLEVAPFTLCGVALSIFLAFRNNVSFDRYWEARRIWGHVLNAARTLASQALCYLPADDTEDGAPSDRIEFVNGVIAFVYALKHQLRGTDPTDDLSRCLGAEPARRLAPLHFRPIAILNDLRQKLAELERRGAISGTQLWMFDAQLNELATTVGGCERIASTPIPYAYGVMLHRTVYIYCVLLPFGLFDSIGVATPIIAVFMSYTLIALEAIASEIAEPFGTAPHHLALDAMTRNIERSLLELCGKDVPAEPAPGPGYLLT